MVAVVRPKKLHAGSLALRECAGLGVTPANGEVAIQAAHRYQRRDIPKILVFL